MGIVIVENTLNTAPASEYLQRTEVDCVADSSGENVAFIFKAKVPSPVEDSCIFRMFSMSILRMLQSNSDLTIL
jgi:hypothetical protein